VNASTAGLAVKIARTNAAQRALRKASASGTLSRARSPHAIPSHRAPFHTTSSDVRSPRATSPRATSSRVASSSVSRRATFRRGAPIVVANVRRRSSPRINFRRTAAKSLAAFPRDHERAAVDGGEAHGAFGATRVGTLLDRLRLHLRTDRFLAERRRDDEWESACEDATAALARIASRMKPGKLAERLISGRADQRR
jgi:hypothetical protein